MINLGGQNYCQKNSTISKWENFVSPDSSVTQMKENALCSFYVIMFVLLKKTGVILNVNQIKIKLIEQYNKLIKDHYTHILELFSKQGKEDYVNKLQKNELDLETMIMNEDYFLTHIDLWILCNHYKLPIVLFSNNKMSNLNSTHEWLVLGGNTKQDEYYFVYGSSNPGKNTYLLIEPPLLLNSIDYFKAISGRSDFIEHFITLENFLSNMI